MARNLNEIKSTFASSSIKQDKKSNKRKKGPAQIEKEEDDQVVTQELEVEERHSDPLKLVFRQFDSRFQKI